MTLYKIQHTLTGRDNEECELYSEIKAETKAKAKDRFLSEVTESVEYWEIEIETVIEKKYSS